MRTQHPVSITSPAQASMALQPSRPFSPPAAATDTHPGAATGHDLSRMSVSSGGQAAPIQRMPPKQQKQKKKKTVVEPGSQHHDIAKDKSQPKALGKKLNLISKQVLDLKQNPKFANLTRKDLARKVKGMKVRAT